MFFIIEGAKRRGLSDVSHGYKGIGFVQVLDVRRSTKSVGLPSQSADDTVKDFIKVFSESVADFRFRPLAVLNFVK